jgi:Spy/CpxP family protein refolding chaperone
MVNLRVALVVAVITLWIGAVGCSQSPNPEPAPSAKENNGRNLAEGSGQATQRTQWWRDESTTAELALTDEQAQAINDLMAVSAGDGTQQLQQQRQLTLRYLRALSQEPYNPELVDNLSDRLIEVLSSEQRRRIETLHGLRDILTQEQWTKLWETNPQVFQIGRIRALRGPKISVSETDTSPTPTP